MASQQVKDQLLENLIKTKRNTKEGKVIMSELNNKTYIQILDNKIKIVVNGSNFELSNSEMELNSGKISMSPLVQDISFGKLFTQNPTHMSLIPSSMFTPNPNLTFNNPFQVISQLF